MKGDKKSWLLHQASHICLCFSWLLLLPTTLFCEAEANLGNLMVPKCDTNDAHIVVTGVRPIQSCPRHLSYISQLLCRTAGIFCPCSAQLSPQWEHSQPPLYSSSSVCPSSWLSRPGWCSALLCVPMVTDEPLCSVLGNFPLSRPSSMQ